MSERFIVRTGSGLYRGKPTKTFYEGKPYHRPVYMVWDTKKGRGGKEKGPVCIEEDKAIADKKCDRLNKQEDFDAEDKTPSV